MPASLRQPSPQVVPLEQVASLSRWGRVALAARAAMRTALWFAPGPMRPRAAALNDLLAIDICSTLGMLAAVGARQLVPEVTEAATNAAMAALTAPGHVPLFPSDHAAMLAGLTVEWAGKSMPPDALDAGSVENAQAALSDLQALVAVGMYERGYEYPVPTEFFSRPLWPEPAANLQTELQKWENVLAPFHLLECAERFRNSAAGRGMDWGDAQRRAEAWVRMVLRPAVGPVAAPRGPVPVGPTAGPARFAGSAQPPAAYPTPGAMFPPPSPPAFPVPLAVPLPVQGYPPQSPPTSFPLQPPPQPLAQPPIQFATPVPVSPPIQVAPQPPVQFPPQAPVQRPIPATPQPASPPSRGSASPDLPAAAWQAPLPEKPGHVSPGAAASEPPPPTFRVPTPPRNAVGFADLEPCANALASFIDTLDSRSPFVLAIQGPGGSGRSVLGGILRRRLAAKPAPRSSEPHLTLWFDANRLRPSPTVTTSLMHDLALALDRERLPRLRHLHRLAWSLQTTVNRWKYALIIAACVFVILGLSASFGLMLRGLPPELVALRRDMLANLTAAGVGKGLPAVAGFAGLAVLMALLELFGFLMPCCRTLARYLQDAHPKRAEEARRQLGDLLRSAVPKGSRMVVFIEDLECAGVERSREFLESLKTTLRFPEVVFVLLTDASVLRQQWEEHHDPARSAGSRPVSLSGVVDLQVDLPARQAPAARPGKDAAASRSSSQRSSVGHARKWAAFWGAWSRDWRGERQLHEVFQRTVYVDPPYLAPLVMVFWFFFWFPLAAFVAVQEWVYPPRQVRTFTSSKVGVWHLLLGVAILTHGVLAFQTLDGLLTNLHYVVFYPDMRPLSIWVFLPMELLTMALIVLFGAWMAGSERHRELAALRRAREVLRIRIQKLQANGLSDPLLIAGELSGTTSLRAGEELLIREAVVEECLVSEKDPLLRFHGMVQLASGLKTA